jgi:hypothetical protein
MSYTFPAFPPAGVEGKFLRRGRDFAGIDHHRGMGPGQRQERAGGEPESGLGRHGTLTES